MAKVAKIVKNSKPRGAMPGERRGGRQKGTRNKKTAATIAAIEASGETPLDYMLRVMRDPRAEHERRDRMAQAVAPYVHARLASLEHSGPKGGAIQLQRIVRHIVDPRVGNPDGPGIPAAAGPGEV